jgi:multiple sugar transport system ATP-binding protein
LGLNGDFLAKVIIKNVTKNFGTVTAVKNVSLEAEDKEFVVLLGPSGCGKTTVLRCIAGLEKPDEGEIYIGDRLVNDLEPKDRDIALVFQTYALYPHMTVYQNLAFPLENAKLTKGQVEAKVQAAAKLLKIEDLLLRKPKQLSGGQRQRVALGRAIVREPQVFLMDEPLSNLDAKLRVYMRAEIKRLQRDLGITTIYVTHDQVEAMTMGDKVAIMNEGILQQVGTADEIYLHPANVFVAGFIGSPPMNFFDCELKKEPEFLFDAGVFKYPVPKQMMEKLKEWPASLVLGIRPQDTLVHKKEDTKGLISATVEINELLGDRRVLNLRIGENLHNAVVSSEFTVELWSTVFLEFPPEKISIFERQTGKALS